MLLGKPKIAVRIDDVCPWNDRSKVMLAVDKVESYGVTGLLGVVPRCEDPDLIVVDEAPDFWEWLCDMRDRGWTVALHGYTHVYNNHAKGLMSLAHKNTEFAGNSYEEQLAAIRAGSDVLRTHGVGTDVFFAPAHSYDRNTLHALRETGFTCVSDGRSRRPYVRDGVKHVPCRSYGLPKRPSGCVTLAMHPCEPKPIEPWLQYIDQWSDCLVCWSDLSTEPVRHNVLRLLDERMYLFWQDGVKPCLRTVRDAVLKPLNGPRG